MFSVLWGISYTDHSKKIIGFDQLLQYRLIAFKTGQMFTLLVAISILSTITLSAPTPCFKKTHPHGNAPERCALTNLRGYKPGRFFFSFVFVFGKSPFLCHKKKKSKLSIYWSTSILLHTFWGCCSSCGFKREEEKLMLKRDKHDNTVIFFGQGRKPDQNGRVHGPYKALPQRYKPGFLILKKSISLFLLKVLLRQTASWRHFFSGQCSFFCDINNNAGMKTTVLLAPGTEIGLKTWPYLLPTCTTLT